MKHKRYDEGGEVEDYEKTGADYDDERPTGSFRLRGPASESMPSRAVKAAPRAAPKPAAKPAAEAPKPAAKPAAEAPKPAAKPADRPAARGQDFIDRMSPNNPLRKIRARGMGETLPSGPTPEDTSAAQSRIVERDRAMRDRSTPIGSAVSNAFKAIRERGSQGTQSYAKGGAVSASRRADGCAQRGKTRGKML